MYSLYSIHTAAHYILFLKPLSYNREFCYNLIYTAHAVLYEAATCVKNVGNMLFP